MVVVGDRATAWTKFWRILKAGFLEKTFQGVCVYVCILYMFTRKAKEKPQLRVQKFWEGFSPTSSAPGAPLPSTARAGLWVVISRQLFLPQAILDTALR